MDDARSRSREPDTCRDLDRARQIEIRESLRFFAERPAEIAARLAELDREWDIERALAAAAGVLSLGGLALAAFADRRLLLLPAAVAGILLQHALQGWCPPVPLLRQLGFRTHSEICRERCGLGMLLGNLRPLADPAPAEFVAELVQLDEAVEA
ncbi:MAG TPA: DUF2892 domain-containing protein [Stellaceae bacterium]|nr:DUF2892 domain-containing protein [Stellaceae bacterium]